MTICIVHKCITVCVWLRKRLGIKDREREEIHIHQASQTKTVLGHNLCNECRLNNCS